MSDFTCSVYVIQCWLLIIASLRHNTHLQVKVKLKDVCVLLWKHMEIIHSISQNAPGGIIAVSEETLGGEKNGFKWTGIAICACALRVFIAQSRINTQFDANSVCVRSSAMSRSDSDVAFTSKAHGKYSLDSDHRRPWVGLSSHKNTHTVPLSFLPTLCPPHS